MNNSLQAHEQLLFRHEVLRARLDIRDFFLKNTVREVYENIGQVLSLVRMQLAMLSTNKITATTIVESPGNLVGQSIRDLRVMCKSFYPDADILNEKGFVEVFKDAVKILYQGNNPEILITGIQKEIQPEVKLIVFKMIQEILILIKESEGTFNSMDIAYLEHDVTITVTYDGIAIPIDTKADNAIELTLAERAQLINGNLSLNKSKNGLTKIRLSHPLKYLYE